MPRGDKSSYTGRQKRMAEHIEQGYENRGVSEGEAERRAWATVNKETHGGEKSGSGVGRKEDHSSARKGGRIGGAARAKQTQPKPTGTGRQTRANGGKSIGRPY